MNKKTSENFGVRYEKTEIQYATQFLISPGNEEVLIDFSSGLLTEDSKKVLPIQTRLALPWSTIDRLTEILNQVVSTRPQKDEVNVENTGPTRKPIQVPKATLPQMETTQTPG